MAEFPRLYARAKTGQVKWWQVVVDPGHHTRAPRIIITHAPGLTAKSSRSEEEIEFGKNIGRANETSPLEQAMDEARSRFMKKKDSGYTEEMPGKDQVHNNNTLGLIQPMLALPFDKLKGELPDTVWVQPKLDGHRALIGWVDGRIRMWSRRGKWIDTMYHIVHPMAWCQHFQPGMVLDGELYIHGEKLQNLGSLIKKKQPESERVQYHVYDMFLDGDSSDLVFEQRWGCVWDLRLPGPIIKVPTECCRPDEIESHFRAFRDQGYEGAMVRLDTNADCSEGYPYEPGFRSQSLLKVKEFHDGEWEVKAILRGNPKVVQGKEYQVAILDCGAFRVTAPGDAGQKSFTYLNPHIYIGRKVTVQYAFLTKEGVPFHPVAVRWHEEV